MTSDWGEGGRGAPLFAFSVIPPPPRLISQFTLMITETEGGREGERGGGNYAVSVQLILSLLTGAAGSFSTYLGPALLWLCLLVHVRSEV